MPSETTSAGKGNTRGRGRRGGQGGRRSGQASSSSEAPKAPVAAEKPKDNKDDDDNDGEICFICANPVAHWAVSLCNHKTCHICGLRMRALYKSRDCVHCRTASPFVIFTDDPVKKFEEYGDADFTMTDSVIGIKYANDEIVGDAILLLQYNCPDASCDFAGLGWPDLHRHVKLVHKKRMCDLCTRNKKVFTHEHELFADKEFEKHMRRNDDTPGAADQTGFKGHPLCGFCRQRFYDDDKLYEHCRMKHERCFICDRSDSRRPSYFLNYDQLERHFRLDHFPCLDPGCLEKKFVVFDSEMDLQAHQLQEHPGRVVPREARIVNMSTFEIRPSYQEERRGESSAQERRSRARGSGPRGRDPNADEQMLPTLVAVPLRRDEVAFQRQMAINSAPQGSNRLFGAQLSTSTPASGPATTTPSPAPAGNAAAPRPGGLAGMLIDHVERLNVSNTADLSAEERTRLVRHGSVIERAANHLGNDPDKMAAFRAHVSSYRQGSLSAPQLIDAFFTLFANVSSNALGILVRELADLFEDKVKADNLRKAWQDWRAINEDYPSLPGLSGMQGQSSGSSGWANAAAVNTASSSGTQQKHSNRVLRLKNSTRLGVPAPNTSRALPNWVAVGSIGSSSRPPPASAFPSLPSAAKPSTSSSPQPSSSQGQQRTSQRGQQAPPAGEAFPALPAAPKPQTTIFGYGSGRGVRRDWGQQESNFQWGGGSAGASSSVAAAQEEEEDGGDNQKGKKGKKGKKVLLQWG